MVELHREGFATDWASPSSLFSNTLLQLGNKMMATVSVLWDTLYLLMQLFTVQFWLHQSN